MSRRPICLSDSKQEPLTVSKTEDGVTVKLPAEAPDKIASVVVLEIEGPADVAPYASRNRRTAP